MKPGIKQISEITGFSAATVSNALNQKKGVNQKTADDIVRVAKEIGYLTTEEITKIKLLIYKKNGLIIDDTPFFTLLINGIEQECREAGFEMAIGNVDARQSDYEEKARQMVNEPGTAIILLGTELEEADLNLYRNTISPILLLDYWSFDMDFNAVMINNADSARMAVNYLYNKGHKKIGYLKGKFRILGFRQRQSGYHSALLENQLEDNKEFCIELDPTMNGAYRDMLNYLEENKILPTAYFADNDMIALGAMKAFQEKGYRIPEDISVIGFDDLPFSEIATPGLTSLRVPKQEMGRMAVRKIIEMMKGDDGVRTKLQVCTAFIERYSVR